MPSRKDTIVFLDAGTLDYGDISFRAWNRLGRIVLHDFTRIDAVVSRLKSADMAITNKCIIDRRVFEACPNLRAVHVSATGVNNVDLEAAARNGTAVTNVAGYSTESVVQFTFAFILSLASSMVKFNEVCRSRWSRSRFFMLPTFPVREVAGKTLAILGYGAIGKRVAEVGRALGMKVLVSRIPGRRYAGTARRVALAKALREADFLSIHAPLTPLTRNLIDEAAIRTMKPGAFIINLARGGIIDEKALYRALKNGRLAGAAVDVLSQEPPPAGHPLLKAPNMLLTPHMAWASLEARETLIREVALNIAAFQRGKKRNRIV